MSIFTRACGNVAQAAVAVDPILDLNAVSHFINSQLEAQRIPGLALAIKHSSQVSMLAAKALRAVVGR